MNWCRGKRPRGARSPQLLVILFLALAMTQCVNCAAGHGTGIFKFGCPCKIEQARLKSRHLSNKSSLASRTKAADRVLIAFGAAQPKLARIHHLLSKTAPKTAPKQHQ